MMPPRPIMSGAVILIPRAYSKCSDSYQIRKWTVMLTYPLEYDWMPVSCRCVSHCSKRWSLVGLENLDICGALLGGFLIEPPSRDLSSFWPVFILILTLIHLGSDLPHGIEPSPLLPDFVSLQCVADCAVESSQALANFTFSIFAK